MRALASQIIGVFVFSDCYKTTESVEEKKPIESIPPLGVYDNGLITFMGEKFSEQIWSNWSSKYSNDYIPFASSAFGELFLFNSRSKAIEHFCPQTEHFEFIDSDTAWVINEFPSMSEVKLDVLKSNLVDAIIQNAGKLTYGNCFILQPWQRLGGKEIPQNFHVGELDVYHRLLSQA